MTVVYGWLVVLHSWGRWAVFLTGALVAARALQGRGSGRPWGAADAAAARAWVGSTDVQVLLGMTLYFVVSPVAAVARLAPAVAWGDPMLRFFGALHPLAMVGAFAATHAAWIAARRVDACPERFSRLGLGALAALGLAALATPWPSLVYGRPLLHVP
ncbi:MAG TPA: hypothetical protein VFS00_29040 [Polyangiaceae bacterium]|nr:hypothetical protein [Polyangiaceae bacterium]